MPIQRKLSTDEEQFWVPVSCWMLHHLSQFQGLGVLDSWLYPDSSESIEGSIGALAISAVIAAIQWVGYAAIVLVTGFQPMAESIVDAIKKKIGGAKGSPDGVDANELNKILTSIVDRLDAIESPSDG